MALETNTLEAWDTEKLNDLVVNGIVPDFWDPSMAVSFRLLQSLITTCEQEGKSLKYALPALLKLLIPNLNTDKIPRLSNIKEQLKRKKNLAHPDNPIPWLSPFQSEERNDEIGPYCTTLGIFKQHLSDTNHTVIQGEVTYGAALELRAYMTKTGNTWAVLHNWLTNLGIIQEQVSPKQLYYVINRISDKKKKFPRGLKRDAEAEEAFLQTQFFSPAPSTSEVSDEHTLLMQKAETLEKQNEELQEFCKTLKEEKASVNKERQVVLGELHQLEGQVDVILGELFKQQAENEGMTESLRDYQERFKACEHSLKKAQHKIRHYAPENIDRREARTREQLKNARTIVTQMEEENEKLKQENVTIKESLTGLKREKHNLQKQLSYYQTTAAQWKQKSIQNKLSNDLLKAEIKDKNKDIEDLAQQIEDAYKDKLQIDTTEDGIFTEAIRTACISLHSLGIGIKNITKCIQVVAGDVFGVDMGKLPAYTTLRHFLLEANILGKIHVGRKILDATEATLHLDATTDKQRHFLGFQASTQSGPLSLGMKEIIRETTADQLATFEETMKDIAEVVGESAEEKEEIFNTLILTIRNMMTDQHVVNKKLRGELESLRRSILEKTCSIFPTLEEEEKNKLSSINHWFCLLHVLLGIADATEKALREYESILAATGIPKLGRYNTDDVDVKFISASVTSECIRSICSLITTTGHPAAGLPEDFLAFLSNKHKTSQFKPFKHNRFNILADNALATLIHLTDIQEFLDLTQHTNNLVQSVKADINDPVILAIISALATFHILITEPFHRLVLHKEKRTHILDMNPVLLEIQQQLEKLSTYPDTAISTQQNQGCILEKDKRFIYLLPKPGDNNLQITLEAIGMISTASLVTFSRQVQHQLPGGIHTDNPVKRTEAFTVPKSNSIGESQFAVLKQLRAMKPHSNVETLETTLLWTFNKTSEWLHSQNPFEKEKLMKMAREKCKGFKQIFADRRSKTITERLAILRQKETDRQQKEERSAIRTQQTLDVVIGSGDGQCKSGEDVDDLLRNTLLTKTSQQP